MAITMTDDNWSAIMKERDTVLVDFDSPYCGPCRAAAPALEQLDRELGDRVAVAKMNVDEHPSLAGRLGIMGVPTFVLFRGGQPVNKTVGFRSKDELIGTVRAWLDNPR
ncbi:thioredoxin family protein [Paenibacillus flagellatus]|uniref:Thioredoxin n=1 Tax=Paenibacillus flagellatus TaxID=2211139 RepID=A0A2V5K6W9_9BACL|nr:thioredoxin family protein [Paenibacillus flagellatus]PYI53553.1 thioredoxin [Paenibacillus flagellatus]